VAVPLLKTKLFISPVQSEIVPRPRLKQRLNATILRAFTSISAPAGFGKTTLLREWISDRSMDIAWFSIDRGDNDPIRFWTYVIAAMQTIEPELGKTIFSALQTPQPPSIESLLAELINEISAELNHDTRLHSDNRVILVLDDYHQIHNQSIHELLTYLINNLPPTMQLVIATRTDPPLRLAQLRAQGKLF